MQILKATRAIPSSRLLRVGQLPSQAKVEVLGGRRSRTPTGLTGVYTDMYSDSEFAEALKHFLVSIPNLDSLDLGWVPLFSRLLTVCDHLRGTSDALDTWNFASFLQGAADPPQRRPQCLLMTPSL